MNNSFSLVLYYLWPIIIKTSNEVDWSFPKGTILDLRQYLATERPLIMMKKDFCFTWMAQIWAFNSLEFYSFFLLYVQVEVCQNLYAVYDIINFENNLSFLSIPFPIWPKNSGELYFSSFLRGFIEGNNAKVFGRRESDFKLSKHIL